MNRATNSKSCARLTVNDAISRVPTADGKRLATIFEHGTLLVEIYVYAPQGNDPQQPHTRDEIYFVAAGNGEYVCGDTRTAFDPTDLLFAAAGVEHRFEDFTDDLVVWVIFYGLDNQVSKLCGRYTGGRYGNPNPHASSYISVYVNQTGRESMMTRLEPEFPQGSIIVKEKLTDPRATAPELLTAMVKRAKGYNPESGDWEYLVLDGSASTIKAQGKLEECNVYHVTSKGSDYIDRVYLPREIRAKLQ